MTVQCQKVTWNEVLKALFPCKNLIELDLSDNNLKDVGSRLIELIKSLGRQPSLQLLNLKNCEIPANVGCELVAGSFQVFWSKIFEPELQHNNRYFIKLCNQPSSGITVAGDTRIESYPVEQKRL